VGFLSFDVASELLGYCQSAAAHTDRITIAEGPISKSVELRVVSQFEVFSVQPWCPLCLVVEKAWEDAGDTVIKGHTEK
jgi:hypothetical protein